jgi:hypothetical protein
MAAQPLIKRSNKVGIQGYEKAKNHACHKYRLVGQANRHVGTQLGTD